MVSFTFFFLHFIRSTLYYTLISSRHAISVHRSRVYVCFDMFVCIALKTKRRKSPKKTVAAAEWILMPTLNLSKPKVYLFYYVLLSACVDTLCTHTADASSQTMQCSRFQFYFPLPCAILNYIWADARRTAENTEKKNWRRKCRALHCDSDSKRCSKRKALKYKSLALLLLAKVTFNI